MAFRSFVIVPALTVAVGFGTAVVVWRTHAQSNSRTAFTANLHEALYRYPGGEQVLVKETAFAVTSTGSQVEVRRPLTPAGQSVEQRIIIDPVRRTRVVVDGLTGSLTTTYLSAQNAAWYSGKPGVCTEDPAAKHSRILGFDVVESVQVLAAGTETLRTKSWAAPALDCFPLRSMSYMAKDGGPAVMTNFREATKVMLGAPDPALWAIPVGYLERSPSQVVAEYNRRYPDRAMPAGSLDRSDDAYYKQQQK